MNSEQFFNPNSPVEHSLAHVIPRVDLYAREIRIEQMKQQHQQTLQQQRTTHGPHRQEDVPVNNIPLKLIQPPILAPYTAQPASQQPQQSQLRPQILRIPPPPPSNQAQQPHQSILYPLSPPVSAMYRKFRQMPAKSQPSNSTIQSSPSLPHTLGLMKHPAVPIEQHIGNTTPYISPITTNHQKPPQINTIHNILTPLKAGPLPFPYPVRLPTLLPQPQPPPPPQSLSSPFLQQLSQPDREVFQELSQYPQFNAAVKQLSGDLKQKYVSNAIAQFKLDIQRDNLFRDIDNNHQKDSISKIRKKNDNIERRTTIQLNSSKNSQNPMVPHGVSKRKRAHFDQTGSKISLNTGIKPTRLNNDFDPQYGQNNQTLNASQSDNDDEFGYLSSAEETDRNIICHDTPTPGDTDDERNEKLNHNCNDNKNLELTTDATLSIVSRKERKRRKANKFNYEDGETVQINSQDVTNPMRQQLSPPLSISSKTDPTRRTQRSPLQDPQNIASTATNQLQKNESGTHFVFGQNTSISPSNAPYQPPQLFTDTKDHDINLQPIVEHFSPILPSSVSHNLAIFAPEPHADLLAHIAGLTEANKALTVSNQELQGQIDADASDFEKYMQESTDYISFLKQVFYEIAYVMGEVYEDVLPVISNNIETLYALHPILGILSITANAMNDNIETLHHPAYAAMVRSILGLIKQYKKENVIQNSTNYQKQHSYSENDLTQAPDETLIVQSSISNYYNALEDLIGLCDEFVSLFVDIGPSRAAKLDVEGDQPSSQQAKTRDWTTNANQRQIIIKFLAAEETENRVDVDTLASPSVSLLNPFLSSLADLGRLVNRSRADIASLLFRVQEFFLENGENDMGYYCGKRRYCDDINTYPSTNANPNIKNSQDIPGNTPLHTSMNDGQHEESIVPSFTEIYDIASQGLKNKENINIQYPPYNQSSGVSSSSHGPSDSSFYSSHPSSSGQPTQMAQIPTERLQPKRTLNKTQGNINSHSNNTFNENEQPSDIHISVEQPPTQSHQTHFQPHSGQLLSQHNNLNTQVPFVAKKSRQTSYNTFQNPNESKSQNFPVQMASLKRSSEPAYRHHTSSTNILNHTTIDRFLSHDKTQND